MSAAGPSTRANPARGLALIATALILGIFVLRAGFTNGAGSVDLSLSGDPTEQQSDITDEPPADPEGEGGDGQAEPEPEPDPLAPSDLTVRVANTTSVGGAAGRWSDRVGTNGYRTEAPTDAAERDRAVSAVLYREGLEVEAAELATALGPSDQIEVMPVPEGLVDTGGAALMTDGIDLVVLVGADLANQPDE